MGGRMDPRRWEGPLATWGKGVMYSLLTVAALAFPAQTTAFDDGLTARQREIIQAVMSADGFITEEMHADFWASAPAQVREDEETRSAFVRLIDRSIASGVRFQRESWASMKSSLEAHRVVKTPGYEAAKKAALNSSPQPQFRQQALMAVKNAEKMIEAAAEGRTFHTSRGPMYITPELVDRVLAALGGSVTRFRRLAPSW